jgi:hypothetical protein
MAVASVSRPCVAALLLKLFGSIGTTCTYCAVEFRLTKVCSSKSNYEEQVNLWKVLDTSIIYLGGTVVKCYASWKFRATCYWLMFITYCLTPAECSSKIKVETKISHDRRQADTHALSVDDAPSICSLSYPFPDELLTTLTVSCDAFVWKGKTSSGPKWPGLSTDAGWGALCSKPGDSAIVSCPCEQCILHLQTRELSVQRRSRGPILW